MTGIRVQLKGYRLDKHGRLVPDQRRLDVSTRLKQQSSKRIKPVARRPG